MRALTHRTTQQALQACRSLTACLLSPTALPSCQLMWPHNAQMVSNGNEGYRAWGPYDPNAPLTYPFLNWMNSGLKGDCLHCIAAFAVLKE